MTGDQAFLARFDRAEIQKSEWDHRAHLRVAYVQLARASFAEAVQRMREGIPRLNRAQGVPNTDSSGYHETLTVLWAGLVAERMGGESRDFEAFIAEHPELLRKELALEHYSRETLLSVRARREFVPPDRLPLAIGERAA